MNTRPPSPPRVGARHGIEWWRQTLHTLRHWPWVFLPMGLIMAIIGLVPWIGGFALLILGPTLVAGTVIAAHLSQRGQTPRVHQVFAQFEETERRNETLKLCLPIVAGVLLASLVIAMAALAHMLHAGVDMQTLANDRDKMHSMMRAAMQSSDMIMWQWVGIAIMAFACTFVVLAIPRVALGKQAAFAAMRDSFRLVWRNLGAWVVAMGLLLAGLVALWLLLSLTGNPVIMLLGTRTALYAVAGPLLHAAWHDLDGHARARASPEDEHPQPPPPPTGTLQA